MVIWRPSALAITGDQCLAEDILQEVFLRMYRYAATIDTMLPLEPWLYRVTSRVTYSWVKRIRWLFARLQENINRWALAPDPRFDPERVAEDREHRAIVHRAIDRLPRAQRVVVVLHYLEELSTREIAEVMDVPEGTVKSRLHYARLKLRKLLQDEGYSSVAEVVYDFS